MIQSCRREDYLTAAVILHLFYNNQIKTKLGSATMNQSWTLIFNSKRLSHLLNFPLTTLQIDTKKADPKVSLFQTGK